MDRNYRWERLTASGVISPAPVMVGTVIVMPHDGKQAKLKLYDGESGSDPQIIEIKTGSGQSKVINFHPYFITQRGLYVEFTQDADEALVYYTWKGEGEDGL